MNKSSCLVHPSQPSTNQPHGPLVNDTSLLDVCTQIQNENKYRKKFYEMLYTETGSNAVVQSLGTPPNCLLTSPLKAHKMTPGYLNAHLIITHE